MTGRTASIQSRPGRTVINVMGALRSLQLVGCRAFEDLGSRSGSTWGQLGCCPDRAGPMPSAAQLRRRVDLFVVQ
jgi:hypothetical protein